LDLCTYTRLDRKASLVRGKLSHVIRDDLDLLDKHARDIRDIVARRKRAYVLETTGGIATGWAELPGEDKRAIAMASLPIPGIAIAKFVFGAKWPVAAACGVLSAPILLAILLITMRTMQARQSPTTVAAAA
jgi:hypothetical protein